MNFDELDTKMQIGITGDIIDEPDLDSVPGGMLKELIPINSPVLEET